MRWTRLFAVLAVMLTLGIGGTAQAAGKDKIVIDLVNESATLDPHLQWNPDSYAVYRNIFDNLVTRDDNGKIVPAIATAWNFPSDTEVEFTIRDDVFFHDGSKLTPEDVVYSVQRITDKDLASPQRSQFAAITRAEVIDSSKVKFYTDAPYPPLLAQLVKLSIVPKAVVEKVGNEAFNLNPVGSGPYMLKEWQRGVSITLSANDKYWGDKGKFPTAEFRFVPDPGTRVADLRTGKADIVYSLDYDMAQTLKNDKNVASRSALTERVAFLRPNNGRTPTSNPLIRQAIAYAIDKEGITEGLFGGIDQPTDVMLTPQHAGWTDAKGYPYDPEKAKALVKEAGAAGKEEIIFVTSPVYDQRVVQAVQQMLSDVGLNVRVDMMDQPSFLKSVQTGPLESRAHLSYGRWSCACMDADGVIYPLLHESSIWSMTRRPDLDKELDAARSVIDEAERNKHYKVVNDAIAKDVLLLPLYQCAIIYGANNQLVWQPTADESLFLNRMDWK